MVLFAVGDAATGGTDAAMVAEMIGMAKPDAFLYLGDVYEQGTQGDFEVNYDRTFGQIPNTYPIPGNHDWPNYGQGYGPYFAAKGRPNAPYYFADLGEWGLFMLNSEQPIDAGSVQYKWAAETLRTVGKPGRKNLACLHRPRYCSGSHGDAPDTDPLWQLLGPRCPVILGGHAHNMQQFKPVDPTECRQLVSGAGGRALYAEIPGDERLEWGKADGYGAVKLTLADQLGVEWVDEHGQSLYSSTVAL